MFNVDINNSRQIQPPVFTSINYEISKQELLNAKDTGRSDEKKFTKNMQTASQNNGQKKAF